MKSLGEFNIIMEMDETLCFPDMTLSATFVRTIKVRTAGTTFKVRTTGKEQLQLSGV